MHENSCCAESYTQITTDTQTHHGPGLGSCSQASWCFLIKKEKITSDCGNNEAGCAFMQHNTRRETSSPPSPHKNDVFVIFSAPCRCFLAVVL